MNPKEDPYGDQWNLQPSWSSGARGGDLLLEVEGLGAGSPLCRLKHGMPLPQPSECVTRCPGTGSDLKGLALLHQYFYPVHCYSSSKEPQAPLNHWAPEQLPPFLLSTGLMKTNLNLYPYGIQTALNRASVNDKTTREYFPTLGSKGMHLLCRGGQAKEYEPYPISCHLPVTTWKLERLPCSLTLPGVDQEEVPY